MLNYLRVTKTKINYILQIGLDALFNNKGHTAHRNINIIKIEYKPFQNKFKFIPYFAISIAKAP